MDEQTWGDDDTLRVRVAKAIYGSSVSQARARAEKHDLQHDRLRRVFAAAQQETDRSAAILIFALIFLLVNLAVDIGYAFLNPRIRYS